MTLPCQGKTSMLPRENSYVGKGEVFPWQGSTMKTKKEKNRIGIYFIDTKIQYIVLGVYYLGVSIRILH